LLMPAPQRSPSRERKIGEMKPEDSRVGIVGIVVDSKDNIIVIDDGSGRAEVLFEEVPKVNAGQLLRVIGRAVPTDGGFQLQGEALQDFSGADIDLWRKTSGLWEKSLNQL